MSETWTPSAKIGLDYHLQAKQPRHNTFAYEVQTLSDNFEHISLKTATPGKCLKRDLYNYHEQYISVKYFIKRCYHKYIDTLSIMYLFEMQNG